MQPEQSNEQQQPSPTPQVTNRLNLSVKQIVIIGMLLLSLAGIFVVTKQLDDARRANRTPSPSPEEVIVVPPEATEPAELAPATASASPSGQKVRR